MARLVGRELYKVVVEVGYVEELHNEVQRYTFLIIFLIFAKCGLCVYMV